jgi:hypothetical protein
MKKQKAEVRRQNPVGRKITAQLRPVFNSFWIPIKYGPWAGTMQRMNILSLVKDPLAALAEAEAWPAAK